MYSGGFFGDPCSSSTPAACGLFFGQHDGAVGFAPLAEMHGHGIGGVNFEVVIDAATEGSAE